MEGRRCIIYVDMKKFIYVIIAVLAVGLIALIILVGSDKLLTGAFLPYKFQPKFLLPKKPLIILRTPIETYLTCPTELERGQIERDFNIRFTNTTGSTQNWADYPYQCDSSTFTTTNPTRVKTYNVIRFLKSIQFSRPLPFTQGNSIYQFFISQSTKLTVRPFLECNLYSAGGFFDISLGGNFSRWYPVLSGSNTCELGFGPPSNMLLRDFVYHPLYSAELFVHESYHAIIDSPHTGSGGADATIQEMGAWAAQFYFNSWISLYSTNLDANTKQLARDNAASILQNRFTENRCPTDSVLKEIVNQIVPNSCL